MSNLSKAHRAEILKRMLKKGSTAETNMGEQTPPGMGVAGIPNMGMNPGMAPPQIPPMQVEDAESYDKNPMLDLGSKLLQGVGMGQSPLPIQKDESNFTPIDTIIKNEADASQIWKVMGGYNSVAGRVWQELSDNSKLYDDGRNYFISCFNKYIQNPEKFKTTNPREAFLISHTQKIMEEKNG